MAESLAMYVALYGLNPDVWLRSGLQDKLALVDRQLAPRLVSFTPKTYLSDRRRGKVEAWRPANIIENVFPNGLWLNVRRSDLPQHYAAGCEDSSLSDVDAHPPSHIHHSVLTDLATGAAAHAHLLTRYYPITDAGRVALLTQQVGLRLMESPPEGLLSAASGGARSSVTAGGVRDLFRQAHRAFEPRCITIVTAEPLYETMRAVLTSFDEWLPRDVVLRHAHARLLHGSLSHGPSWAGRLLGLGLPQRRRRGRTEEGLGGLAPVLEGNAEGVATAQSCDAEDAPVFVDVTRAFEDPAAGGAYSGDEEEAEDESVGQCECEDHVISHPRDLASVRSLSTAVDWRNAGLLRVEPPSPKAAEADAAPDPDMPSRPPINSARSLRGPPHSSVGAGASSSQHSTLLMLRLPWTMGAKERDEVLLCAPPPSAHSWELPQVPWECAKCQRRIDGLLRAELLAATTRTTPLQAEHQAPESSVAPPSAATAACTPLSSLVRCVESGMCAECVTQSSTAVQLPAESDERRPAITVRTAAAAAPSLHANASALPPASQRKPEPLLGPFVISSEDPLLPYAVPPAPDAPYPRPSPSSVPSLFTLKSSSGLGPVDFDPRHLFTRLSPANIITVITALLLEQTIVVLCKDTSVLPDVFSALIMLLHPLQWWGMYVPVAPQQLSDEQSPDHRGSARWNRIILQNGNFATLWGMHPAVLRTILFSTGRPHYACASEYADVTHDRPWPADELSSGGLRPPAPAVQPAHARTSFVHPVPHSHWLQFAPLWQDLESGGPGNGPVEDPSSTEGYTAPAAVQALIAAGMRPCPPHQVSTGGAAAAAVSATPGRKEPLPPPPTPRTGSKAGGWWGGALFQGPRTGAPAEAAQPAVSSPRVPVAPPSPADAYEALLADFYPHLAETTRNGDGPAVTSMPFSGQASAGAAPLTSRGSFRGLQHTLGSRIVIVDLDADAVSPGAVAPEFRLPMRLSLRLWRSILRCAPLWSYARPHLPVPPPLPQFPPSTSPVELATATAIWEDAAVALASRGWAGVGLGDTKGVAATLRGESLFAPFHSQPIVQTTDSTPAVAAEHTTPTKVPSQRQESRGVSGIQATKTVSLAQKIMARYPQAGTSRRDAAPTLRTLDYINSDDEDAIGDDGLMPESATEARHLAIARRAQRQQLLERERQPETRTDVTAAIDLSPHVRSASRRTPVNRRPTNTAATAAQQRWKDDLVASAGLPSPLDCMPVLIHPPWGAWRRARMEALASERAASGHALVMKCLVDPVILHGLASFQQHGDTDMSVQGADTVLNPREPKIVCIAVAEPELHLSRLRVDFLRVMVALFKPYRMHMTHHVLRVHLLRYRRRKAADFASARLAASADDIPRELFAGDAGPLKTVGEADIDDDVRETWNTQDSLDTDVDGDEEEPAEDTQPETTAHPDDFPTPSRSAGPALSARRLSLPLSRSSAVVASPSRRGSAVLAQGGSLHGLLEPSANAQLPSLPVADLSALASRLFRPAQSDSMLTAAALHHGGTPARSPTELTTKPRVESAGGSSTSGSILDLVGLAGNGLEDGIAGDRQTRSFNASSPGEDVAVKDNAAASTSSPLQRQSPTGALTRGVLAVRPAPVLINIGAAASYKRPRVGSSSAIFDDGSRGARHSRSGRVMSLTPNSGSQRPGIAPRSGESPRSSSRRPYSFFARPKESARTTGYLGGMPLPRSPLARTSGYRTPAMTRAVSAASYAEAVPEGILGEIALATDKERDDDEESHNEDAVPRDEPADCRSLSPPPPPPPPDYSVDAEKPVRSPDPSPLPSSPCSVVGTGHGAPRSPLVIGGADLLIAADHLTDSSTGLVGRGAPPYTAHTTPGTPSDPAVAEIGRTPYGAVLLRLYAGETVQVREVPELQEAFDFPGFLSEGAPDVLPLLTRITSIPTTTMAFGQFVTQRFKTLVTLEDDAFDRMCLQAMVRRAARHLLLRDRQLTGCLWKAQRGTSSGALNGSTAAAASGVPGENRSAVGGWQRRYFELEELPAFVAPSSGFISSRGIPQIGDQPDASPATLPVLSYYASPERLVALKGIVAATSQMVSMSAARLSVLRGSAQAKADAAASAAARKAATAAAAAAAESASVHLEGQETRRIHAVASSNGQSDAGERRIGGLISAVALDVDRRKASSRSRSRIRPQQPVPPGATFSQVPKLSTGISTEDTAAAPSPRGSSSRGRTQTPSGGRSSSSRRPAQREVAVELAAAAAKAAAVAAAAAAAAAAQADAAAVEHADLEAVLAGHEAELASLRASALRRHFHLVPGRSQLHIPNAAFASNIAGGVPAFRTPYAFQLINPSLEEMSLAAAVGGPLAPRHRTAAAPAPLTPLQAPATAASTTDAILVPTLATPAASTTVPSSQAGMTTARRTGLGAVAVALGLAPGDACAGPARDVLTLCADSAEERRSWIVCIRARLYPAAHLDQLRELYG